MKTRFLILFAAIAIALPASLFAQDGSGKLSAFSTKGSEKSKDYCFTFKSTSQKLGYYKKGDIKVKSETSDNITYKFTCDYKTIVETVNGIKTTYKVSEVEETNETTITFTATANGVDYIFMLETSSETFSKMYAEGKKLRIDICILADVIEH